MPKSLFQKPFADLHIDNKCNYRYEAASTSPRHVPKMQQNEKARASQAVANLHTHVQVQLLQ